MLVKETTSCELELVEREREHRLRSLGRVAVAPRITREPPADLDAGVKCA